MARYQAHLEAQLQENDGCMIIHALMLDDMNALFRQNPACGQSVREAYLHGFSEDARFQAGDSSSLTKRLYHQHLAQEFILFCTDLQRLCLDSYYPGPQEWLGQNLSEFSRLGRLCLHRNLFESGMLALRPLLVKPLRRLKITGVADRIIWDVSDDSSTSRLQRLTLEHCAFDMETLAGILSTCSSLVQLKLHFFVGRWLGGFLFLATENLQAALAKVQDTIESITIAFNVSYFESQWHHALISGSLGSLAGFSRLEHLDIPLAFLYGYNATPTNPLQLHEILPLNLTSLTLTEEGYDVQGTVLCPKLYLTRLRRDVEALSIHRACKYASAHGEHSVPPVLHIMLAVHWADFARVAEALKMDDLDGLPGIHWAMVTPNEEMWCKVTTETWRNLLR